METFFSEKPDKTTTPAGDETPAPASILQSKWNKLNKSKTDTPTPPSDGNKNAQPEKGMTPDKRTERAMPGPLIGDGFISDLLKSAPLGKASGLLSRLADPATLDTIQGIKDAFASTKQAQVRPEISAKDGKIGLRVTLPRDEPTQIPVTIESNALIGKIKAESLELGKNFSFALVPDNSSFKITDIQDLSFNVNAFGAKQTVKVTEATIGKNKEGNLVFTAKVMVGKLEVPISAPLVPKERATSKPK